MTDEEAKDRLAIQNLLATATQAGDRRRADDYAACFTEDGVLELENGAHEGREAIRAFMGGTTIINNPPPSGAAPSFIAHNLTTSAVEFTGDGEAEARTYWIVMSSAGPDHSGFYVDRLRKVGGKWLLAHRKPRTLWFSATSVVKARD
ncbi:MAG: nuclear transport factor 2 family protein [Sphingomonadaceae bacterium]